jgi:predicted XRE-type DNA-binding protein
MAIKKSDANNDSPSVINIIQEMLQKGESEEKIFSTLKEIGVNETQIKNLLLIAQADTYSLLKSEIATFTKDKINDEFPKYKKELYDEITKYNAKELTDVRSEIALDLKNKQDNFEQKQVEKLEKVTQFVESTKELQGQQKDDILRLDEKLEETKLGSTKSIRLLRIIGFIVGLLLILLTAYKFFTLNVGASLDFMILYVITLVAGIVLLILSLI